MSTGSRLGTAGLPLPSRSRMFPTSAESFNDRTRVNPSSVGERVGVRGSDLSIVCNPSPHPSPFGRGSRPCLQHSCAPLTARTFLSLLAAVARHGQERLLDGGGPGRGDERLWRRVRQHLAAVENNHAVCVRDLVA